MPPWLCLDCEVEGDEPSTAAGCPVCGSARLRRHPELAGLAIAHLDADAFFASIEKRDRPELRGQPVIVGGGRRGVVAAACYVARRYGVRSAMPMFKALAACPHAVVIRPDMARYAEAGRQIRALMHQVTPLVEPLSIDEAFLDLTGTAALHGGSPARSCARLARRIEDGVGITVSIGLSHNKFLAKLASDLDKPRGFAVVGRAETEAFLAGRPVGEIWGVGRTLHARLEADGIRHIGELRDLDERALTTRYGSIGHRLWRLCRGIDTRPVVADAPTRSVSAETTFDRDLADPDTLARALWPLSERVAERLKAKNLSGRTVVLKLKTADFRLRSRSRGLPAPTQLADRLYRTADTLLRAEATGVRFRLIGVGCHDLESGDRADPPDLFDVTAERRRKAEQAVDAVRTKLGRAAIGLGRGFAGKPGPAD